MVSRLCFGCVLIVSWLFPGSFLVVFVASWQCLSRLGSVSVMVWLCLDFVLVVSWWLLGGFCRVWVVFWWIRAAVAETTAKSGSNKKSETVLLGLYAGLISLMELHL